MKWLSLLCVVLCLVQSATCQSPATVHCVHFSCPPWGLTSLAYTVCTGAQCIITTRSGHASFVVYKCQDPVTVDLTITTPNSNFQGQFNQSETVSTDLWYSVRVVMSRNATHLHFEVTAIYGSGSEIALVPNVAIFLNPRECMCQSLQSVSGNIFLPPHVSPRHNYCFNSSTCSGFYCSVYQVTGDATIDPCTEELQVTLVDNPQGQVVYQWFFQDSQQVPFSIRGINFTLHVEIVHYNYSMDLEMYLRESDQQSYGLLLHRMKVILDQSNCTDMTTIPSQHPTSSPSTTTHQGLLTATYQSPATVSCVHFSCSPWWSLTSLAYTVCTGAQCIITTRSGHVSFVVYKCQDPVTVDLTITTPNSNFQRQFNHSETVSTDYWDSVHVVMSRNTTHLLFQVTAVFEGDIIILIPNVAVFLNPRECMCQSLRSLVRNRILPDGYVTPKWQYCYVNSDCSGIYCNVTGYRQSTGGNTPAYSASDRFIGIATIDPCTEVLQVTIVHNPQGRMLYQRLFQDSQEEPFSIYGDNFILHVGIVHYNYSMDLEIMVAGKYDSFDHRRPPLKVILDRSNCTNLPTWPSQRPISSPSISPSSTPHSLPPTNTLGKPSPTSHQGLSSNLLAVAIATPLGAALCVVVLVLVVVIVVLAWRHRRNRKYEVHVDDVKEEETSKQ